MLQAWSYGTQTRGRPGHHFVTLLHYAIFYANTDLVSVLLDANAQVNIKDGWGQTCVEVAAIMPNELIKQLVMLIADIQHVQQVQ